MKKILDKVLSPQLFAICYLPWLAINMASVINILSFTRIILAMFAAWAVAVCVKQFVFSGKKPWTDKFIAILMFFLGACLISQVVQFEYGGFDMIGKLMYFAICLLVLYSQYQSDSAGYIKLFGIVSRVLGVVIGLMMLVSDWMFVTIYSGTLVGRSGATVKVGFCENRLYGIFTSPNVGGLFALILIWCSFFILIKAKSMWCPLLWRIFACIQIFAGVMYISVGLSRGTYVSGIAMIVTYLIIKTPHMKERVLSAWKQIAIRILCVAVTIVLCVGIVKAVNWSACKVMVWNYENHLSSSELTEEEKAEQEAIIENALKGSEGRVESNREDIDITNKRASIWTSHLKLLKGKHLIIGVNHPHKYLEKNLAQGMDFTDEQLRFIRYAGGNLHNGYIQILTNGGILAFLPMLAFLGICVVKALQYLFKARFSKKLSVDTDSYLVFSVTLPMVIAVLVDNVFETNFVLMGANFIQAFFWFVAGACVMSMIEGVKNK
ncbi:MAG: hypothetical protein E7388_04925 [Ruminococcaceae bacterium]|nr:hypothetical protein [Oscillospiraceae bacterium]